MQKGKEIALLILNNKNNEFLGYLSLHQANTKIPELGIWLRKEAHQKSYGFEALTLFRNWIEKNLSYDYLKYPVDKRNIASCKLAEKLGGKN